MLISPLRYSGGKSRLYKQIKQYFPKDKNIMIDLFFGGGSIGLNWLNENPEHNLLANDINKALINFWEKVRDVEKDKWLKMSEIVNDYESTKNHFNNPRLNLNAIDFLIKNKCSFNPLNEVGTWSDRAFKENFNKSTFERIIKCKELLQRATITCEDYHFNHCYENSFYYLDPPYFIENAKKLYKFGDFNHYELAKNLKEISSLIGSSIQWVLSINDCKEIRELYKDFNIYEIETIYTSSNTKSNKCKKIKELIITNFKES